MPRWMKGVQIRQCFFKIVTGPWQRKYRPYTMLSILLTIAAVIVANSKRSLDFRTVVLGRFQRDQSSVLSTWNPSAFRLPFDQNRKQRLVVIGAGPTGLGAAYRLFEQGIMQNNTQVVILERQQKPGGLAVSHRDKQGFLWDMGGHVVFSHYQYFDNLLDDAVSSWNEHERAAFAFMKGSSGKRKFIPYPVQDNIPAMDENERRTIFKDLEHLTNHPVTTYPANFDEWLLKNFGVALSDVFMRKYNKKVWTIDAKEMNAAWVGERVAVPDVKRMKNRSVKDSKWGPNHFFRFPRFNGTGGIWQAVSDLLPTGWFHFGHEVTAINIENKTLHVKVNGNPTKNYSIQYDILISTIPLDVLVNMDKNVNFTEQRSAVNELVFSRTHVVGLGLRGQPPANLVDKSWIYFPDSDSPFYRVTVFSKYSDDHVPAPRTQWSLMCECAEPKSNPISSYWSGENIVAKTVSALRNYNFISASDFQILSRYHHKLDHGYPVPSISRERVLAVVQPWLESHGVYSRGRFGGWRYEVANQDHSLMQGVEVVDFILKGIPEETYPNPSLVNSMKGSKRSYKEHDLTLLVPDYEVVLAHYDESLEWISAQASHCHIYHKGEMLIPDWRFKQWERLPNVGRESHTYLHHIIANYHRLANVTVFLQAGANIHVEYTFDNISIYVEKAKQEGFAVKVDLIHNNWGRVHHIGRFKVFNEPVVNDDTAKIARRSRFTVGEFWEDAFGDKPRPIRWCPSASFAVTRQIVHKKPITYYKKLIGYVDDHPNPEEGHYFERLWRAVFTEF